MGRLLRSSVLFGVVVTMLQAADPLEQSDIVDIGSFAHSSPGPSEREVDTAPTPDKLELPDYPPELRKEGVYGTVELSVVVTASGRVINVRVENQNRVQSAFAEAAVEAVKRCTFNPGRKDGQPVHTRLKLLVHFANPTRRSSGVYELPSGPVAESKLSPPLSALPLHTIITNLRGPGKTSLLQAVYPYAALLENRRGFAEATVTVSKTGAVRQVVWHGWPKDDFRLALEAFLDTARFPAAVKRGRAVEENREMRWEFNPLDGDVRVGNRGAAILKQLRLGGEPMQFARAEELDDPLVPWEQVSPVFPSHVSDDVNTGEALIEFYVDEKGQVQLPRIVSASEPAFGYAACQAIANWRFRPPRRAGIAVIVRVQVPVRFRLGKARGALSAGAGAGASSPRD